MFSIFISSIKQDTDEDLLTELYHRYRYLMMYYAEKTVNNEKTAEDMVHEAFMRLIPHTEKLRSMSEPVRAAYIRSTVRNVSLNFMMKKENTNFNASLNKDEEMMAVIRDPGVEIEDDIIKKITAEEIRECIKLLPQIYRDILNFKYLLEMSDAEIGKSLGISKDSVRQYIVRARRRVFEIYNEGKGVLYNEKNK